MTGRKFLDTTNHGVGSRHVVETQKAIQTIHVDLPLDDRILENGFDFGPKKEIAAGVTEIERLDADAVSRQDQTFLRPDPNRECKHSTQPFKTVDPPFTECMQDDLRVSGRNESAAPGAKLMPQFPVIVDFSVEYQNHVAVLANNRLVSAVEVDDSQAHGAQTDIRRFIDFRLIFIWRVQYASEMKWSSLSIPHVNFLNTHSLKDAPDHDQHVSLPGRC